MNNVCLLPAMLIITVAGFAFSQDDETGIYESMPATSVSTPVVRHTGVSSSSTAAATTPDSGIPAPLNQLSSLSVKCDVDDARVIVNGTYLGIAPFFRHGFRPGLYEVVIKKAGYEPFSRVVRARENDTVYIECRLIPASATFSAGAAIGDGAAPTGPYDTPKGNGTLIVTCSADSASVVVNKSKLGTTPFSRTGFIPGYYEVEVKKGGYEAYDTTVQIGANDTVRIAATMISLFGRCKIASNPPGADVLFDNVLRGTTPFDSTEIRPGLYQVRIELPQYIPWSGQLTIEKNRTDSIRISLMSVVERDSLRKYNLRVFKNVRRVIFGTGVAGFLAMGLYYNSKVSQQLEREKTPWSEYNEANLSAQEYTDRFASYQRVKKQTDSFMRSRNASYVVGSLFAAGFAISIPF